MEHAKVRFLTENGRLKVQADSAQHSIYFEVDQQQITGAFFRAGKSWSPEVEGLIKVTLPFKPG